MASSVSRHAMGYIAEKVEVAPFRRKIVRDADSAGIRFAVSAFMRNHPAALQRQYGQPATARCNLAVAGWPVHHPLANASRSALTLSLCVSVKPCGAPG